ncbi:adenylate/guanylate cyclase domain-containing protein [Crocinitomix algicola]|uniref:adenylate/guanylate cyclase domain-containing protein n=1 Tax=Crocinitomix algicola TaxID=1740263 RepID=UPI00082E54D7|nr:adenylate/guanylate cyclase domain-containing protein [Crocinitomix algicola]
MFDRIINILIVENDVQQLAALLSYIENPGHNIFIANSVDEASQLLKTKEFVFVICSLDFDFSSEFILKKVKEGLKTKDAAIIVTSSNYDLIVEGIDPKHPYSGTDYLKKPFQPAIVKSKVQLFRRLYFKHQRVSHLLESILPTQIIEEYSIYGKSSPKKKTNTAILFTDFVNFTQKTKNMRPDELVKKLDDYFSRFDTIIQKYQLEKIKTIGDAYMAVGGVTEKSPNPILRTALAAIEMRNFVITEIETEKALGRDYWEIRIGIHSGDIVAGVVGTHKFSFDVWGDPVNIAARCEQNSHANKINISSTYYQHISDYFNCTARGKISVKNAGEIEMYFLDEIKKEYSLYNEGRIPNAALRKALQLPPADFEGLRTYILTKLKAELDPKLLYHSWEHTERVEAAVIKYGELENLSSHELFLVRTAALFHDSGFIFRYEDNEKLGVDLFRHVAPRFGYSEADMNEIETIIYATQHGAKPKTLLEKIMCDADLDYLGRIDYHVTAKNLFDELALYGTPLTEKERISQQIIYLEQTHVYYTNSANNVRNPGKQRRLKELKQIYKNF